MQQGSIVSGSDIIAVLCRKSLPDGKSAAVLPWPPEAPLDAESVPGIDSVSDINPVPDNPEVASVFLLGPRHDTVMQFCGRYPSICGSRASSCAGVSSFIVSAILI